MCDLSFEKNLYILDEISNLNYNWNNNKAEAFSSKLINKVKNIIKQLSIQPDIFPTACESIQLEYVNERGDYLEYEIFENGKIRQYFNSFDDKIDISKYVIEINNIDIENFMSNNFN